MRTQAQKLSLVLQNGNFRQVKLDEMLDEINKFQGESLYTKEEQSQQVICNITKYKKCWEFTPCTEELKDLLAYNTVRIFSENPYVLIDRVYNELINL